MEKHELSQRKNKPNFKIYECGERGSQFVQFEQIARNITNRVRTYKHFLTSSKI